MKCNVCGSISDLSSHPYVKGAFLCGEHQIGKTAPMSKVGAVVVDREELIGLKTEGLVTFRSYIYFALRIDGITTSVQSLNLADFCDRWAVNESDAIAAIAALSKKGIVKSVFQVNAQVMSHKERIQAMEESLAS
jgi:hypothetical protein